MVLNTSRSVFIFTTLCLATLASADLKSDLSGAGIKAALPGDSEYDAARAIYNTRITYSPAAFAFPNTPEDVSKIIQIGVANNLTVTPKSGGHSFIANSLGGKDGALVVDLSNMKKLSVDSSSNIATIETGNRLGNVALGLNDAGRALPHGACPMVGIGGHSAFGGWGLTSRMWGFTLDTIKAANVVLANGTIARVSNDNNPDLFWAIRGAAPSFAITTSLEFETLPAPQHALIFSYTWSFNGEAAGQALLDFQSYALDTPDLPAELGILLTCTRSNVTGEISFNIAGGWYDEPSKLDSALKPFFDKLPAPVASELRGNGTWIDSVEETAAIAGDSLDDINRPDVQEIFYSKSLLTPQGEPMTQAATSSLMNYLSNEGSRSNVTWIIQALMLGGHNSKTNAIPLSATSFVRRDSLFTWDFRVVRLNQSTLAEGLAFSDGSYNSVVGSMPSDWDYNAYANYIDDREADWQKRYFGSNYDRLRSIKTEVDPNNLFHFFS
ncbi:hypothetical protein V5O48_015293, partial [Marasmius crinis-equi]